MHPLKAGKKEEGGRTDGRADGLTGGLTGGWTDGRTDGRTDLRERARWREEPAARKRGVRALSHLSNVAVNASTKRSQ